MKRTAEFVTPKHPDKLADRIADTILDAYMAEDKNARAAIEVLAGHGAVNIIDVLVILQHSSDIPVGSFNELQADYNQDGTVNVLDALALLYAV